MKGRMNFTNSSSFRRRLLLIAGILFTVSLVVIFASYALPCDGLACLANVYIVFYVGIPLALFSFLAVLMYLFLKLKQNKSRTRRIAGGSIILLIIASLSLGYLYFLIYLF